MKVERDDTDDAHLYTINGKPVPGVTSLLKAALFVDDTWFRPEYATRGKRVHKACELSDKGIAMPGLAQYPEVAGRLEAWKKFVHEMDFEAVAIEEFVGNELWGYAGQLDRRGSIRIINAPALLDIKSGEPTPADAWQTAAYENCVDGYHRRFGVHLRESGDYKLVEHDGIDDWDIFRIALDGWKVKDKYGLLRDD